MCLKFYLPCIDEELGQLYLVGRACDAHMTIRVAVFEICYFDICSAHQPVDR